MGSELSTRPVSVAAGDKAACLAGCLVDGWQPTYWMGSELSTRPVSLVSGDKAACLAGCLLDGWQPT